MDTFCGTPAFLAPELIDAHVRNIAQKTKMVSPAIDIWSLGATIWYCMTNDHLRTNESEASLPSTMMPSEDEENAKDMRADAPTVFPSETGQIGQDQCDGTSAEHLKDSRVFSEEFAFSSDHQILREGLVDRNAALPTSVRIAGDAVAMIQSMIHEDPNRRPSATECRKLDFIARVIGPNDRTDHEVA